MGCVGGDGQIAGFDGVLRLFFFSLSFSLCTNDIYENGLKILDCVEGRAKYCLDLSLSLSHMHYDI